MNIFGPENYEWMNGRIIIMKGEQVRWVTKTKILSLSLSLKRTFIPMHILTWDGERETNKYTSRYATVTNMTPVRDEDVCVCLCLGVGVGVCVGEWEREGERESKTLPYNE